MFTKEPRRTHFFQVVSREVKRSHERSRIVTEDQAGSAKVAGDLLGSNAFAALNPIETENIYKRRIYFPQKKNSF